MIFGVIFDDTKMALPKRFLLLSFTEKSSILNVENHNEILSISVERQCRKAIGASPFVI